MRIEGIKNLSCFESAILNFFLLHPHENQSKFIMWQIWVKILMITLVYSKGVSVRNNLLHTVHTPVQQLF
jgi:hypothetical protein